MRLAQKVIFLINILVAIGTPLAAQETATTATTPPHAATTATPTAMSTTTTTTTTESADAATTSAEIRQDFHTLLRQRPPELSTILALDPTLLSNDAFLAQYPELAKFISEHPQVRQQSRYYVEEFEPRAPQPRGAGEEAFEAMGVGFMTLLFTFAAGWAIRTLIEQRRWTRLSRIQSEVHTKILERFGTSSELLEYMRTPAGTKFLESAPIPLHADRPVNAPMSRVLWSVQFGIVIAAASIGMMIVSTRFSSEGAQGLFALGAVAFCVGIGFIVSAAVSVILSKRLGIWQGPVSDEPLS